MLSCQRIENCNPQSGVYHESLTITKNISVMGHRGLPKDIVLTSDRNTVVTFRCRHYPVPASVGGAVESWATSVQQQFLLSKKLMQEALRRGTGRLSNLSMTVDDATNFHHCLAIESGPSELNPESKAHP